MVLLYQAINDVNGTTNNTIDLTSGTIPTNFIGIGDTPNPDILMSLLDNLTGNVDVISDERSREREKSKLMKVCVDRTQSALDKRVLEKNTKLTKSNSDSSTGFSGDDISSDEENMKPLAVATRNK